MIGWTDEDIDNKHQLREGSSSSAIDVPAIEISYLQLTVETNSMQFSLTSKQSNSQRHQTADCDNGKLAISLVLNERQRHMA